MGIRLYKTEQLRNKLINDRRKALNQRYETAAQAVNDKARELASRLNNKLELKPGDFREVEETAKRVYSDIAKETRKEIEEDMLTISQSTFDEFSDWLISHGLPSDEYFQGAPKSVVRNILNGNVYKKPDNLGDKTNSWGLSKAIWGDNQKTMSDIHRIISQGVANGDSAINLAKAIEEYTGTGSKSFDWSKVYPWAKTKIDYNSSRLVRTLLNHAFQQSFKAAGDKNPWIGYYIWHSAFAHGRTCQICMDLDGRRFAKDSDTSGRYPDMPIDHPNGLCWWSYEVNTRNMVQELADWANGEGNAKRNSEIDEYVKYLKER